MYEIIIGLIIFGYGMALGYAIKKEELTDAISKEINKLQKIAQKKLKANWQNSKRANIEIQKIWDRIDYLRKQVE